MNNKQKLLNIVKNLNLTQSQQNELVNILSSGLGNGGGNKDKVFEIKIRASRYDNGDTYPEFMINGIGWFSPSAGGTDDTGWRIDVLNGEEWENKDEIIRELFKDIKSYNKLKLTQLLPLGDTEIPISSSEELTYQLMDINGMLLIMLYSKIYRNSNTGYLLIAQITPDGTSMSITIEN